MLRTRTGRAWLVKAKSSLLLTVFLSAGTSLPGLDGLLFHLHAGEHQRAQIHVEPAGGCLDHAEHCVLGRTATGAGAVATPLTEVRVEPASRSALKPLPAQPGRSRTRGVIPQPRAPPALRAV
jgi:hypothetical protein